MISDYNIRLNNALKDYHKEVYDSDKQHIKDEFKEDCDCPVCDSTNFSIFCIKDGYTHRRCRNCAMVYLSPRFNGAATTGFYNSKANEVYNEEKFHSTSDSTEGDDEVNIQNLNIVKAHVKDSPKNLKLLEVGSGRGFFLRKAKEAGFDVHALELNELLYEQTKDISDHVYNVDLFEKKFDDSYFDVIYMRDVIEHIHNPIPFMEELNRIAKKGCIVVFATHNIDSLLNSNTGAYHTTIFAFEHPVHWSPKTLAIAGKKTGFKYVTTHFDHEGQSIRRILSYMLVPSFTYIFKPSDKSVAFTLRRIMFKLVGLPVLFRLDNFFMTMLSKILGKGSYMGVVLTK